MQNAESPETGPQRSRKDRHELAGLVRKLKSAGMDRSGGGRIETGGSDLVPGALATSAEVLVQETVGGVSRVGREVVLAVGVFDLEVLRHTVEAVDGGSGGQDLIDALPAEVGVAQGGVDEDWAGGQRANQFVEIEGDIGQASAVIGQAGHVTGLTPAAFQLPVGGVAFVVIEVGIEAATGHDYLDAGVKDGLRAREPA